MCAACVAQGITYVGGAVGTLRVMAARAEHKRRQASDQVDANTDAPARTESATA